MQIETNLTDKYIKCIFERNNYEQRESRFENIRLDNEQEFKNNLHFDERNPKNSNKCFSMN